MPSRFFWRRDSRTAQSPYAKPEFAVLTYRRADRESSHAEGPADQPTPSAMIAWLIEAGEQFLIDTEVCAPPGQVGG